MLSQPVKTHMPSVAQLIISIFGLVTSIFSVLAIRFLIKMSATIQNLPAQTSQQFSGILWIGFSVSLISVPSIILSIRRLSRKPENGVRRGNRLLIMSLLFLLVLPLIYLVYKKPDLLDFPPFMALLTVIVVSIPLWWFVELGQNRLTANSSQRQWGLVNFSVFVGMPLVIFIELILVFVVVILGIVWLTQQPEFKPLLMTLQTQLMLNPNELASSMEQINPLIQKPGFIATCFFLFVLLIPFIEEIFKPLAIWFFIKHDWQPSEGFTAGLICGAAFGLVESMFSVASLPQESWAVTLFGRIGTGLLHTLTTGLTGWALVSSWRDGKYTRIGLTYLASVSIHGLWNFFALLFGLGPNLEMLNTPILARIADISPWILGALFTGMLIILILMNRKIRSSMHPPALPPAIPPLPVGTIG